jgi:hypothetical protein
MVAGQSHHLQTQEDELNRTATVALILMTELNCHFKLGNDAKIGYFWEMFAAHSEESRDMKS